MDHGGGGAPAERDPAPGINRAFVEKPAPSRAVGVPDDPRIRPATHYDNGLFVIPLR
jgi:hypothetical protein